MNVFKVLPTVSFHLLFTTSSHVEAITYKSKKYINTDEVVGDHRD